MLLAKEWQSRFDRRPSDFSQNGCFPLSALAFRASVHVVLKTAGLRENQVADSGPIHNLL